VRVHVAVEVHADEPVELQEAGIDVAHHARIGERHLGDDVVAEPVAGMDFGLSELGGSGPHWGLFLPNIT
jgi:hypothetical protein